MRPVFRFKKVKYYSERDAATMLGLSIFTLRDKRKKGLISYTQFGRNARYTEQDVEEYLRINHVQCKTPSESEDTNSSTTAPAQPTGTGHGTTMDEFTIARLAQQTFK